MWLEEEEIFPLRQFNEEEEEEEEEVFSLRHFNEEEVVVVEEKEEEYVYFFSLLDTSTSLYIDPSGSRIVPPTAFNQCLADRRYKLQTEQHT